MPCFPAQCSYLEVASGLCPCLSEKACLTVSKSSLITHTFCMRESPEVPAPPQHEVLVLFFFFFFQLEQGWDFALPLRMLPAPKASLLLWGTER